MWAKLTCSDLSPTSSAAKTMSATKTPTPSRVLKNERISRGASAGAPHSGRRSAPTRAWDAAPVESPGDRKGRTTGRGRCGLRRDRVGDHPLELAQQLVLGRRAPLGLLGEAHLHPDTRELFEQQHLIGVAAREAI